MNTGGGLPSVMTIKSEPPLIRLTNCDTGDVTSDVILTDLDNQISNRSFNLNVNLNVSTANTAVGNFLISESGGVTPRTPEILNSLIAMTNPLDQYNFNGSDKDCIFPYKGANGNDSCSSLSNGSSATSPATGAPPSVQKTCSELIKAGLKLSIQSKRKLSASECSDITTTSSSYPTLKRLKKEETYPSDEDYDSSSTQILQPKSEGLTPEDEERRRRRRERNKIAATKCRLKKRERTVNLVTESEVLESQNIDLKTQLQELEQQRKQLAEMLSQHTPICINNKRDSPTLTSTSSTTPSYNYDSPTSTYNQYDTSPYIRPESANILASSYTCITQLDPLDSNYMTSIDNDYSRSDFNIPTNDGYSDSYLPKASLLVVDSDDIDYNQYQNQSVCHNNYNQSNNDTQSNSRNLNDGCIA